MSYISQRLSNASTNDDIELESRRVRFGSLDSNDMASIKLPKRKSVSFKENFVEITEIQNWKRYNIDVSVSKYIWQRELMHYTTESRDKEVDSLLCNNCTII